MVQESATALSPVVAAVQAAAQVMVSLEHNMEVVQSEFMAQVLPKEHTPLEQVPTWLAVPEAKVAVLQESVWPQILQVWSAEEQKLDIWHRELSPTAESAAEAQLAVYAHCPVVALHAPTWLTSLSAKSLVPVQVSAAASVATVQVAAQVMVLEPSDEPEFMQSLDRPQSLLSVQFDV